MFLRAGNLFRSMVLTAILMAAVSCSDITEYDSGYQGRLVQLSAEGLAVIGEFPVIPGARCIMLRPGMVFVASTEGKVHVFDSESRETIGEYTVGPPSAAGYSDMVYSYNEGTAYLIGANGNIIEMTIPDCQVIDEFSLSTAPFLLEVTPGPYSHLWVADAVENRIYQVKLSTNISYAYLDFTGDRTVLCMESSISPDTLLVGTSSSLVRISSQGTGNVSRSYMGQVYGEFHCLAAIPGRFTYMAVVDQTVGELNPFPESAVPPSSPWVMQDYLDGAMFFTGAYEGSATGQVICYSGDNETRIWEFGLLNPQGLRYSTTISGYPLDAVVSGEGNIYVLTY